MNHNHMAFTNDYELILIVPFFIMLILYFWAAITTNRRRHLRKWPPYRYVAWVFGIVCAAIALVGPLANRAHTDFITHMVGHLLLGMLSPFLIVLAAPLTLFLRALRVPTARRFSHILHSWPVRYVSHPIVASILNIGGLWLLYMSNLYRVMQQSVILHLIIQFHIFVAGYLFTTSMIYMDPIAHRFSFIYRTVVLLVALAGHTILSKYIYVSPPIGVSTSDGKIGGMLMYYGGDVMDIAMIYILCLQWYRATRPRISWGSV